MTPLPALYFIVESGPLKRAREELKEGKATIPFGTNKPLRNAQALNPQNAYIREKGVNDVGYRVRIKEITDKHPDGLNGGFEWYYIFSDLVSIPPIRVTSLKLFKNGKSLDAPPGDQGVILIEEPDTNVDADADADAAADTIEEKIRKDPNIPETTKKLLVDARKGQGKFRENVLKHEKFCRVTGMNDPRFLEASHIKSWTDSNNEERLDGHNGLMLSPHIHRLFDKGYLTFKPNGEIRISRFCEAIWKSWNLPDNAREKPAFTPQQKRYLEHHNENVFEKKYVELNNEQTDTLPASR